MFMRGYKYYSLCTAMIAMLVSVTLRSNEQKEEYREGDYSAYDSWQSQQNYGTLDGTQVPTYEGNLLSAELTHLMVRELVLPYNFAGAALGAQSIGSRYYLLIKPEFNIKTDKFALGMEAPLRFLVYDHSPLWGGSRFPTLLQAVQPRKEDWDSPQDILRILRYAVYGKPDDPVYASLSNVHPITMGYGQIFRRFQPNLDMDFSNLYGQVGMHGGFAGIDLLGGPFPVPQIVGGQVNVHPLYFMAKTPFERTLSVSFGYYLDLKTPITLIKRKQAGEQISVGVNSYNQLLAHTGRLHAMEWAVSSTFFQKPSVDLTAYLDYAHLFYPSLETSLTGIQKDVFNAGGGTVGLLLRATAGVKEYDQEGKPKLPWNSFAFRMEGRAFHPHYVPSYFNSLYQIQSYQFFSSNEKITAQLPTKLEYIATQKDSSAQLGYYAEFSYRLADYFGISAVLEDAYDAKSKVSNKMSRNFILQAESLYFSFMQLVAAYQMSNFFNFKDLFAFQSENALFYISGRFRVLPFLFINLLAKRTFFVTFADRDGKDEVDGVRYSSIGYKNAWSFAVDVSLGATF